MGGDRQFDPFLSSRDIFNEALSDLFSAYPDGDKAEKAAPTLLYSVALRLVEEEQPQISATQKSLTVAQSLARASAAASPSIAEHFKAAIKRAQAVQSVREKLSNLEDVLLRLKNDAQVVPEPKAFKKEMKYFLPLVEAEGGSLLHDLWYAESAVDTVMAEREDEYVQLPFSLFKCRSRPFFMTADEARTLAKGEKGENTVMDTIRNNGKRAMSVTMEALVDVVYGTVTTEKSPSAYVRMVKQMKRRLRQNVDSAGESLVGRVPSSGSAESGEQVSTPLVLHAQEGGDTPKMRALPESTVIFLENLAREVVKAGKELTAGREPEWSTLAYAHKAFCATHDRYLNVNPAAQADQQVHFDHLSVVEKARDYPVVLTAILQLLRTTDRFRWRAPEWA
uniref:Uncharacterized protein n=1 Tax=Palpitomonas bilix TaxID=652834 RepID=A0A7S3DAV4_9EUKA|mmetsp:Transcript_28966/g.74392  ORF Transcript_28966/g.74392 Transcript_28966/m.74392 type:complete len:394 (+) Transcript_28966:352-1533(+)